ncbi:pilin [Legionella sp. W05-934-2]|uniref:pilin n=1 Tax=Legionella sp. W05-934-2 TaxID=1198649 RepID=UPI003462482E
MHYKIQGFTLIELLIVVTIVAILAVVAISSFQNYSIRARVTEGLGLVTRAKIAVSEVVLATSALPANQAATGYEFPAPTDNVSDISIGANGLIIITFTVQAGNGTINFQPAVVGNSGVTWDCTGGTLQDQYRPAICR